MVGGGGGSAGSAALRLRRPALDTEGAPADGARFSSPSSAAAASPRQAGMRTAPAPSGLSPQAVRAEVEGGSCWARAALSRAGGRGCFSFWGEAAAAAAALKAQVDDSAAAGIMWVCWCACVACGVCRNE